VENELLKIKDEALEKIEACTSLKELNDIRVLYLGKKGPIEVHALIDEIYEEYGSRSKKNIWSNK
jgi:hypothetical protein